MQQPQWLQTLRANFQSASRQRELRKSFGLELLLPLPLLGLCFWVGSGFLTERMLSRDYSTTDKIRVSKPLKKQPSILVLSILVEINKQQGFSIVKVKTANSALKELEFVFPETEFSQVEAAIAQELGLSIDYVRKLVRYQVGDEANGSETKLL